MASVDLNHDHVASDDGKRTTWGKSNALLKVIRELTMPRCELIRFIIKALHSTENWKVLVRKGG